MKNSERRAEERVPLTQRGSLAAAHDWSPCLIEDISCSGFMIMSVASCGVGDVLALRSELYPSRFLQCKICVRHVHGDSLGTKIVDISAASLLLCRQFIGERVSLMRFRQG